MIIKRLKKYDIQADAPEVGKMYLLRVRRQNGIFRWALATYTKKGWECAEEPRFKVIECYEYECL